MTDAAKIPSANQNPWTTTENTTGTRIPTGSNVMFYGHGQSSVEPTAASESAADAFFAGWNRQMTEPQQQSQQQYHLSQHQNQRTQTQPSHHGMAIQNIAYPDYPVANTSTFQPPVPMTGALGIQPADRHVTDKHLLQPLYYDTATSVVSNEDRWTENDRNSVHSMVQIQASVTSATSKTAYHVEAPRTFEVKDMNQDVMLKHLP